MEFFLFFVSLRFSFHWKAEIILLNGDGTEGSTWNCSFMLVTSVFNRLTAVAVAYDRRYLCFTCNGGRI
jgi:hypothetical protein